MKPALASLYAALSAAEVSIRWSQDDRVVAFLAVPGRTTFEVETDAGFETREARDWIFPVDRLVLGGAVVLPARGARVEELDDAGLVVATYSVTHPAGDRHYRWADPYRRILRVHSIEASQP